MPIRNGLRSTLRAKGRSALFALLIFFLTLTLTLGAGMWGYCAQILAQMDESYTSIALIEYMGADYPNADAPDGDARAALAALDQEALAAVAGVELWEAADSAMALVEGCRPVKTESPYSSYGVVTATRLSPMYNDYGYGIVAEEDLPETRIVTNNWTGDWTFCAPGREPLEVPHFLPSEDEEGVYHYYTYTESEDGPRSEEKSLTEEELPALYLLPADNGSTLVGQLPEGYTTNAEFYCYDPAAGTHTGRGRVFVGYTGVITGTLYSKMDRTGKNCIFDAGSFDFEPERDKEYLLHGAFVSGGSANTTFSLGEFCEGCETPPYLELAGEGDPALTEGIFAEYAERYRAANQALPVTASSDIAALEPFQQGTLYLEEGRFPEKGESGVCVLSGAAAARIELGVGDTVHVSLLSAQPESRYLLSETGEERSWQVVGVTNGLASDEGGVLWVSDAEGGFGDPLFGYTLGRAVLDNRRAIQAEAELEELLPPQTRLTLYDQGYAAAARPLETMRSTAMAVTVAAICGAAAALLLFAFLFVGRQRETVGVLVSLGTPAGKIRLWLLSGGAFIAGLASLLGAAVGGAALGRVVELALAAAAELYSVDTRYSEAAMGLVRQRETAAYTLTWPALAAGGAVFLAALLLCLVFLRQARRENAPKRGRTSVRVPRGATSTAGRGPARFALLSARRGGWRSVVAPAAALVLTLFVGILAGSAQGWSRQLEGLYEDAQIQGQITSTTGRSATNLSVSMEAVQTLQSSGLLSDLSVSIGWHYWLPGEMPQFSSTAFGSETRDAWISKQPILTAANGLAAAAEFCYSGVPEITWLEGWDESCLRDDQYSPAFSKITYYINNVSYIGGEELPVYPAVASSRLLERLGLSLGDEAMVYVSFPSVYDNSSTVTLLVELKVVGSFTPAASQDNLYVPLSFWCGPEWLAGERELIRIGTYFTTEEERDSQYYIYNNFSSCRFTLASSYRLEDFRNFLAEKQFSRVGKLGRNRTTVLLRDQAFTEAVGALGRYISFSRILSPVLLAVVGLLGFIISWLMINGRRMEFAVMRGLGAPRGRVFASFFLEQGALCLAGSLLGALALSAVRPGAAVWLAAAGFLACYLAGCALSVLVVGRTKLMDLLSERE